MNPERLIYTYKDEYNVNVLELYPGGYQRSVGTLPIGDIPEDEIPKSIGNHLVITK
jgi:hypothetical protein